MKPWYLRERLVFGLTFLLSLTGLFTWFSISEQEDPFFPYRNGGVSITAPGMSATAIEATVIEQLDRALSRVDEVYEINSTAADGFGSISIGLQPNIYDTDKAWEKVRAQVNDVKSQTSGAVTKITLEDKAQDAAGILLSINSNQSILAERDYALFVRDELYKLSGIRSINLIGDAGEQVEVLFPQERMIETGISPLSVAEQIANANSLQDMGVLRGSNYFSSLNPITRLNSVDALSKVEISTSTGNAVTLSQIASINRKENPLTLNSFWVDGIQKLGLSIVLPPNKLRVVDFGDKLTSKIERLNEENPEFQIKKIFFQPEWTKKRRNSLALSLLMSSAGVGLALFFLMSTKLALIVSLTVPAIALTSLAFFGIFGGVLQQMSIAGLVISLGLMVDNSIVMSELIAKYRGQGLSRAQASKRAILELYRPLATSTMTTIAAFVPMLLAEGDVADFIRMIPVMVVITIVCSYAYAILFLPTVTNNIKKLNEGGSSKSLSVIGAVLARVGTRYPWLTISAFIVLAVLSFMLSSDQSGEFFPKSSRNQAFVDIEGDFGTSHEVTLDVVKRVETILSDMSSVQEVVSFVGNSGPRFYYNLSESPNATNVARVVFTIDPTIDTTDIVNNLNVEFSDIFTTTRVAAKVIGQGPPIDAPIEVRVLGDTKEQLLSASEEVFELINSHGSTVDTRRNYVMGKPKLSFSTDKRNLGKADVSKGDVSDYFAWRTLGITATNLPVERQELDVVVRDNTDIEGVTTEYLMNTVVMNANREMYPIGLFVKKRIQGEVPTLSRRNGFKFNVISANVLEDAYEDTIIAQLIPEFERISERYSVELEFGGEAEEQAESNGALLRALPMGVLLLFGSLVLQFNSLRIAATIMITIPAAILGVKPMLSLVGVNFGFMSILGVLALTGIVVNTAIILIDRAITNFRSDSISLKTAVEKAVIDRFRPIILTAITTIIGMIPLAMSASPLWPPLAWTMIGGLLSSTILCLIVLPAFLLIILNEDKLGRPSAS